MQARALQTDSSIAHTINFILFGIACGLMIIRPGDYIAEFNELPFYEIVILICFVSCHCFNSTDSSWAMQGCCHPISLCVYGVFATALLSQLVCGNFYEVINILFTSIKIIIFYQTFVISVNTQQRFDKLALYLAWCILLLTVLSLCSYHNIFTFAQSSALATYSPDADNDQLIETLRLRATGFFNDPNDFSLLLLIGIYLAIYSMNAERSCVCRLSMLGIIAVLFYAFVLTHSRGGFLALLCGVTLYTFLRHGKIKAFALSVSAIIVIMQLASSRQTSIDIANRDDTAYSRIALWSEALVLFKEAPILGIGMNQFYENVNLVCHNSFLHSFVELGFLGGTFFVGLFYFGATALYDNRVIQSNHDQIDYKKLLLICMLFTYACGLLTLSRVYINSTYLIVGIPVVMSRINNHSPSESNVVRNTSLTLCLLSIATIVAHYIVVSFFSHL